MCDLVPLFPHDSPVLKEMHAKFDEIQKKVAKAGEVQPLIDGVTDSFQRLLGLSGQQLRGSQNTLNPYSATPELSDAPIIYAQDAVDHTSHMVQVDQLLRGIRLSNCTPGQRVSPGTKFVQELLATNTQTAQEEPLAAESKWVTEASRQFLQLHTDSPDTRSDHQLPESTVDVRQWLLAGGIITWDARIPWPTTPPEECAATLVIGNTPTPPVTGFTLAPARSSCGGL